MVDIKSSNDNTLYVSAQVIIFCFIVTGCFMVAMWLIFYSTKDETPVVVKNPSPTTIEKILRGELTFKVVGSVKPTEGVSALPIGSVLVKGKNPNPGERDVVVNAQVIPFREIPVGTEVTVHVICDTGISPRSFFYLVVEKQ